MNLEFLLLPHKFVVLDLIVRFSNEPPQEVPYLLMLVLAQLDAFRVVDACYDVPEYQMAKLE